VVGVANASSLPPMLIRQNVHSPFTRIALASDGRRPRLGAGHRQGKGDLQDAREPFAFQSKRHAENHVNDNVATNAKEWPP
jgi:hypothetical protein